MDKEGDLPNPESGDTDTGGPTESADSSDVKPEETCQTELQNHVDPDSSPKHTVTTETMDLDSSKDRNDNEGNELKEESTDQNSQDGTSQTSQETPESSEKVLESQDKPDTEDDIGKLNFETAPNVSMEDTQEDHSQALDPFDALLKDTSEAPPEPAAAAPALRDDDDDHAAAPALGDDDDDHAAAPALDDDDDDDHAAADDAPPDDAPPDEDAPADDDDVPAEPAAALAPGADEEVCLLPDTEREISDADKAAAERALAETRRQAEHAAALAVPKAEPEAGEPPPSPRAAPPSPRADHENGDERASDSDAASEEPVEPDASRLAAVLREVAAEDAPCAHCGIEQPCSFRAARAGAGAALFVCNEPCVRAFTAARPGRYTVARRKYLVREIEPRALRCSECEETKPCHFYYDFDGEDTYYCSMACLEGMMADEKEQYAFERRRITIERAPAEAECLVCGARKACGYAMTRYGVRHALCDTACIKALNGAEGGRYYLRRERPPRAARAPQPPQPPLLKLKVISNATDKYLDEGYKVPAKTPAMVAAAREERERSFQRRCAQCAAALVPDERALAWETMDFCDELCLGRYQNKVGSRCANCASAVLHTSLGKYCVRFGYDIRQFCNSACLEEFKKGLKICCYCQRDISAGHQGFLAPVGDKGQFKDFCSQRCMERFDQMTKNPAPAAVWAKCAVCSLEKATSIEVEAGDAPPQRLCSEPCFAAFKFVNNVFPDQCRWCKKYFERRAADSHTVYEAGAALCFCSRACVNVFISNTRHIVPCNWCKVKKYNFDMIRRTPAAGQPVMMCSLNCLNLYQVSVNAVSSRKTKCDMCKRTSLAQYHLTMSDATVRNFCTYQCVMSFQGQYSKHPPLVPGEAGAPEPAKAVPTGAPRRTYSANCATKKGAGAATRAAAGAGGGMPVISSVQSLAAAPTAPAPRKSKRPVAPPPPPEPAPAPRAPTPPPPPPRVYNHVIVKTLPAREVANKATQARPLAVSKGVSCRPHPCTKECQTDASLERRVLVPVPVPVYVPVPCAMWSLPFPVPVPIPLPVPVPVFIPTTRNSAKGIMKEINKIHDKMPTDPFEAELLMMAEMVAGDKKKDQSDSDTDDDNAADETFSPVGGMDGNNAFGEDMLQMALKMATEYEEQPVDLESAMTANTITPSSHPALALEGGEGMHHHHMMLLEQQRAVAALRASATPRKRAPAPPPAAARARSKRRRAEPPPPPDPPREPVEKPDANMCLKYTFGVNAWKQWVMTKNAEIENSSVRRKPFKSEILQLTADELNYSLCLFVKEVRKPNGSEYAPDTIYYLVLGIQQYLFENGRIDNIFTDPYYEKFTDCLDEVARKFSVLYNDSQYIVTRVEEEHLWESKQLGAHSPHVLLSTLMFFNTKHFNLVTVEEHMQLSFSHIMKHWKRNPNAPGQAKIPGSRNVLLRFYPPQSALEANSRKKKVYEQQENEENPLRCPVKLYEFYISKCPESVRTRNDVFYLQPERSCVPDSPVWYSTAPLSRAALAKMLHRVKMVKEINIALLTS